MTRKLYDKTQDVPAPVRMYRMIDGRMVVVEVPAVAPENEYKRRHGRCEDAPCCGCCD